MSAPHPALKVVSVFFFQAEDGIRDSSVTGVQTCALPISFIASAGLALASSAQAMPVAPLDQAEVGAIIQVYGGCGWGGHRGPFGRCRPLYNCPPGWRTGPWGRVCRPYR